MTIGREVVYGGSILYRTYKLAFEVWDAIVDAIDDDRKKQDAKRRGCGRWISATLEEFT